MPKIYTKIHRKYGEILVAMCDEDIIGLSDTMCRSFDTRGVELKFSDGEIYLEVKKEFYDGELIETDKLPSLLSGASIANLTGNHTVNAAIEHGFINSKNVLEISGVKHAQMIRI